jgi:hypothetical protein
MVDSTTSLIWSTWTSGTSYDVPCCVSSNMFSIAYFLLPTSSLYSPMSLSVNFLFCTLIFYTYSSTLLLWRSYPPLLRSCGSCSYCWHVVPLYSAPNTSFVISKGLSKSRQMPSVHVLIFPTCNQIFIHFFFVLHFR